MLCCAVLFCFVLFCFVLFCFVLFRLVLFRLVLFRLVLFRLVLFRLVLFCFVLFCFDLFCFVLSYRILYCICYVKLKRCIPKYVLITIQNEWKSRASHIILIAFLPLLNEQSKILSILLRHFLLIQ